MNRDIADMRKDYSLQSLDEHDVSPSPVVQFGRWWNEATDSKIEEVNAMTLATASNDGVPHARIVLLKAFSENGFVFFTNYNSHKGVQLEHNPRAALVFFWKELERQVRIEGTVKRVKAADSDAYFISRPQSSRIGAWASPQSMVIESREVLDENVQKYTETFKDAVPRPAHWGGYSVVPTVIEFWQGRSSRLHDRLRYTLQDGGVWKIERLAP